ncbi:MAG: polysulfide reductase NrfD [Gemmatimonadales bacterium]|jgi:Ni/Fe-hydrogenase subunit HybB-like protein
MRNRIGNLKDVLWVLAFAGLVAGGFRLWYGLGATTNLTDAVPWGLWKILNMVAGVAISTAGFTVGFLVYVLKLERFRPLMKPAILVAFLGYGCSCLALLFDIGLPHRFWHPFILWNEHSFLFEVFWCVTLYFTVTAIELAPLVFEKLRAEKVTRFLHRIAFAVVVVGISLSSLHHSSLGSLFLVTPQRLHPLWYTPLLPLLFILSAMGAGMMFVVLIRFLHAYLYDPDAVLGPSHLKRQLLLLRPGEERAAAARPGGRDMPMLTELASIATGILGVYLLLQLFELGRSGSWAALVAGTWESWLFAAEILLTAVIPILLVWLPGTRGAPLPLGYAALSASAGLALNRVDVGIFGYFREAGAVYFPSLAEWALSLGVVAAAGLALLAFVENFPVFEEGWRERRRAARLSCASFDSFSRVWETALRGGLERVSLIAVLVIPFAWAVMYPSYRDDTAARVRPAAGIDVTRTTLLIDGNQSGVRTEFPHAEHRERLGGDSSCGECHHLSLPGDETTPCSRCHGRLVQPTRIFEHEHHRRVVAEEEGLGGWIPENRTCTVCHTGTGGAAKTAATAKPCLECHEEDRGWAEAEEGAELAWAVSYMEAMHTNCVTCHEEEGERQDRPTLGDCATCHSSLTPREGTAAPLVVAERSRRAVAGKSGDS